MIISIGEVVNAILTLVVILFTFYAFWHGNKEKRKDDDKQDERYKQDHNLKEEIRDLIKDDISSLEKTNKSKTKKTRKRDEELQKEGIKLKKRGDSSRDRVTMTEESLFKDDTFGASKKSKITRKKKYAKSKRKKGANI